MDNAKFWWSSSETPQPPIPPADVIGQSLRFRAPSQTTGPYLLKSSGFSNSGDVWTYSCWIKGWGPSGTTAQWQAVIMAWFNNSGSNTIDELFILETTQLLEGMKLVGLPN